MAWKENSVLSQKQTFVTLVNTQKFKFSHLCEEFGISRRTGYNIMNSFKEHGLEALSGLSKSHKNHPLKTKQEVEERILHYKEQSEYRNWGGPKIRHLLFNDFKLEDIPSGTTVQAILKKNGKVRQRRPRLAKIIPMGEYFKANEPNHIMSIDFKGDSLLGNRKRCYPLTIADDFSRNIFGIEGLYRARTEAVIPVFERVFREYGLPELIHSDNGPPFGSAQALRRMTRLSVWFMERGITPVYSDPGCPQQNGKLERMHRTLKADTMRPMASNMKLQQERFDRFRQVYNEERPHEGLNMKTPSQIYVPSKRLYDGTIKEWQYGKGIMPRMVSANGAIRWKKNGWIRASSSLIGRMIGMLEVADGFWELYYRHVLLGYFEEQTMKTYEIEEISL